MAAKYNPLDATEHQVEEVTNIMRGNIVKVLERGEKLTDLEDKSEHLRDGASRFEMTARKLKRKFWWKNLKFTLGIVFVILVLIMVIILIIRPWK
jgi:hypothetical protein